MTNLILAAIAALIVGIVIGAIIGRSGQGSTLRQRRAEQQAEEVRNEYTRYQAQVNEHFMESAHLLRRFNDAYRDVNQHMARGADRLCNDEYWLKSWDRMARDDWSTAAMKTQSRHGIMRRRLILRTKAHWPKIMA